MDNISQGPDDRNAEEWDAEEHDVKEPHTQRICQPDSPAVHHTCIGVHLAVGHTYIHGACYWGGGEEARGHSVNFRTMLGQKR